MDDFVRGALGILRKGLTMILILCSTLMLVFGGPAQGTTTSQVPAYSCIPVVRKTNLGESAAPTGIAVAKIAVVKPIFSDTAYNNAFYVFYAKYASSNQAYITTDLHYLNVTVKYGWGWSDGLNAFITSDKARRQGLLLGKNTVVIDEINVTDGGLFHNSKRAYDVVILGFTEYVTEQEYYAYKRFVAEGGTLIIMDACNFLAEVKYYPSAIPGGQAYLSLVKGHGWEFNGTHAWKSVPSRWPEENQNWVGSNYWHCWSGNHYDYLIANTSDPISIHLRSNYGEHISTTYGAHEENFLQNFTDTGVIGYWHFINPAEAPDPNVCNGQLIAAYDHRYINGTVFHSGIMASDRVALEDFLQDFLMSSVRIGFNGELRGWHFLPDSASQTPLKFCNSNGIDIGNESGLTSMVYCYVTLDTTWLAHAGAIYNLSSVYVRIFARYGYSQNLGSSSSLMTIRGTVTNSNGLCWLVVVNTTVVPDGNYAFEFDSLFISVDSSKSINEVVAVNYPSIVNRIVPLRNALVAISMSFSALTLACVFLAYSKSANKGSRKRKKMEIENSVTKVIRSKS
jgi:hypothetical protein